jgi:hypothetical protein
VDGRLIVMCDTNTDIRYTILHAGCSIIYVGVSSVLFLKIFSDFR